MNPNKYQELADRTKANQRTALEAVVKSEEAIELLHCVIGMVGELGELASNLEKWIWYGQPFDKTNWLEENGDLNWYQVEGLNATKQKFSEVLSKNIYKLEKRYPEKFEQDYALEENRDREAEREILERDPEHNPVPVQEQTGQGWAEPPEESEDIQDPTVYEMLDNAEVARDEWKRVAKEFASMAYGQEQDYCNRRIKEVEQKYAPNQQSKEPEQTEKDSRDSACL